MLSGEAQGENPLESAKKEERSQQKASQIAQMIGFEESVSSFYFSEVSIFSAAVISFLLQMGKIFTLKYDLIFTKCII